MPKLKDLNESERERAKVNKSGIVLCIECEKHPAKISEYGMLRRCSHCEKLTFGPTVRISELNGIKSY